MLVNSLALLLALEDPQEPRRLIAALDGAFVPSVDRLCRERGHFVAQCVAATAVVMEAVTTKEGKEHRPHPQNVMSVTNRDSAIW